MKIVETDSSFELHISSAVTDNYVTANNKRYFYKRLVIPTLLINFFLSVKPKLSYVYLYFHEDHVFLSVEKLSDIKYSKRKLMKFKSKNSYFINLNTNSLVKHDIIISDIVLFKIRYDNVLNSSSNICIELIF